jgi:hypothetical protein
MPRGFRRLFPGLTASSLVRKGYLPLEIPPPFTTVPLADLFDGDARALTLSDKWTECTRHNLARLSGFRRPLKIPNPRSYIALAMVIEKHWDTINAHCKTQRLAISRPVATRTAERAARSRFHIRERPKLRARLWRGQRFVLFADVSQFYPTLYTHAIPWALHGKAFAKAHMRHTDGDEIDKAMSACSGGQTIGIPIGPDASFVAIGIPIGPDASFVVAETVLTAVDAMLKDKLGNLRGFRYLDDYELAFGSRGEAEEAQLAIEGALGDFELIANPFKTHIRELPLAWSPSWTHDLRTFPIRTSSPALVLNDLIALFSRAAEIAGGDRHKGALKYALLKSRDLPIGAHSWPTFQALVWSAVSTEPTTLAVGLDLLQVKAGDLGLAIDRQGAAEALEPLIRRNAPLRNGSEVAWAIWAAILLEVDLSSDAAGAIAAMEDDFVALLALDADERGRFPGGTLDKSAWEVLVDYDDVLLGPHWLLAYEGTHKGWLRSAAPRVAADPFFSVLKDRDVYFYDRDPARDPFTGPGGPLPGAPIPDEYL